jgi:predicted polyphosphate/ATP-dependent NAD kinase
MKKWGFIYTLGDEAAQPRSDTLGSASCELVCMGVPSVEDAPAAAKQLLEEGVELIELCGAFGGGGLAAVVAAVDGQVPVGGVFYGAEAGTGLHRLFG